MRKLLFFVLGLLVVLVLACIPFFLRLDHYNAQLAAHLSQRLNHKVVIGKLNAGLFPPTLKLHDVGLLNAEGNAPLLHVESVAVPLNIPALFHGTLAPQALHLRGWVAYVHRNTDGGWAWNEWLVSTAQLGEKAAWPLQAITFDHGECHAMDPYGPGPQDFVIQVLQGSWELARQYTSVDGVFNSLPSPVNFQFQGSGQFISELRWSGVLTMRDDTRQWKLECKMDPAHIEASGQSDQWRFDSAYAFLRYYSRLPIPPPVTSASAFLQDWKSRFEWQGSTLSFTQSAAVAGGRAEASGSLRYLPSRSSAGVDLAVKDVKIQSLTGMLWGNAAFEGIATGLAHFDLVLSSHPWDDLQGVGSIALKDGRYFWPEASAKTLAKAHMMRYFQKKYPGFLQTGMNFSQARAQWQARSGVFYFDDTFMDLGDVKAAFAGQYDAARRGVDAYARIQLRERDKELIKDIPPAYVYQGEKGLVIQPMHGRLQGALADWRLRALRAAKVPAPMAAKLRKTLQPAK